MTGTVTSAGETVTAADLSVDLTTVTSDESRRDNQFRGRIMDIARFPTATFSLAAPIDLGSRPSDAASMTASATGTFTIRGKTRRVTFDVTAKSVGTSVEVGGSIPVVFADFGIPDANFGPATVEDRGEIEFLVVLRPR